MVAAALLLGVRATQYITLNPALFEPHLRARYQFYIPIVAVHAAMGVTALVLGPALLSTSVRQYSLRLHKILGRVYLTCILFGSITGTFMAARAYGGIFPRIGFLFQSILWFGTAWVGLKRVLEGNVPSHRDWMKRNYALTFAAVTLRLQLSILLRLGVNYLDAYRVVSWASWGMNLAFAEFLIRTRPQTAKLSFSSPFPALLPLAKSPPESP